MTTLNALGLYVYSETQKEVEAALSRIEGVDITSHMLTEGWTLEVIGKDQLPDVLIYEINGKDEAEVDEIEHIIREYTGKIAVYVTAKNADVGIMRRLMRAGAKDVLSQPIQVQELVQDITNALTEKRTRLLGVTGERGGVIGFLNAKGGSGATSIAVNVAHVLATTHKANVALIDMDIQFGAVCHLLDLAPKSNIMEALISPERIDPVFLRALMTKHESGIDVLCSPSDLSPMGGISSEAIGKLLDTAAEHYDYVIVDIPRILTAWTMAAIKYVNPLMVVSQNSITTIRDAKLLLNKLVHEGVHPDTIELINNRAMAKMGSVTIDKLKETLGKDRVHRIRNDYKTAIHAQDQGRPITMVSKHSHFSKDVQALASYFANLQKGEEKKGLFSKLFT